MSTSPRCRGCDPDRAGRCGACHRARILATRWHCRGDTAEASLRRSCPGRPPRAAYASPRTRGEVKEGIAASALELERDVELGAVGFDLSLGIQFQIELGDL